MFRQTSNKKRANAQRGISARGLMAYVHITKIAKKAVRGNASGQELSFISNLRQPSAATRNDAAA